MVLLHVLEQPESIYERSYESCRMETIFPVPMGPRLRKLCQLEFSDRNSMNDNYFKE